MRRQGAPALPDAQEPTSGSPIPRECPAADGPQLASTSADLAGSALRTIPRWLARPPSPRANATPLAGRILASGNRNVADAKSLHVAGGRLISQPNIKQRRPEPAFRSRTPMEGVPGHGWGFSPICIVKPLRDREAWVLSPPFGASTRRELSAVLFPTRRRCPRSPPDRSGCGLQGPPGARRVRPYVCSSPTRGWSATKKNA